MPRKTDFHRHRGTVRTYFRVWRLFRRLSQLRLAEKLDTSKTRVSMKERGLEGWDDAYLAALAQALDVPDPLMLLASDPTRAIDEADGISLFYGLHPPDRTKVVDYMRLLRESELRSGLETPDQPDGTNRHKDKVA